MKRKKQPRQGFALIIVALLMAVAGILLSTYKPSSASANLDKLKETQRRLEVVKKAIDSYKLVNATYPCPASRVVLEGSPAYGQAVTCGTAMPAACGTDIACASDGKTPPNWTLIGTVPTRTLQIADYYMYDAWGKRLNYAIDSNRTATPITGSGGLYPLTIGTISSSCNSHQPEYYLGSAGPNGTGAYNKNGKREKACSGGNDDTENCDDDINFYDNNWITSGGNVTGTIRTFDDITVNPKDVTVSNTLPYTTNLNLWLDAADKNTVYNTSDILAADGDQVKTWKDKSGAYNGGSYNNAVQVTASQDPLYKANIADCSGTMTFDGVNDVLTFSSSSAPATYTRFIVAKSTTNNGSTETLYMSNNTNYYTSLNTSGASTYGYALNIRAGSGNSVSQRRIPASQYAIYTIDANSTANKGYVNGVDVTEASVVAGAANAIAYLGAYNASMGFLNGSIGEFISYSGNISTVNRKAVECYLATKWKIFVPHCTGAVSTAVAACPAGTTGCKIWYDASDTSTIFKKDGTTGASLADGDEVAIWQDKSGNQLDAVGLWNDTTRRPKYYKNAQNGKGAVRFDGGDDVLQTMASFPGLYSTAFAVVRQKYNGSSNGNNYIYNLVNGTTMGTGMSSMGCSVSNTVNTCGVRASNSYLSNYMITNAEIRVKKDEPLIYTFRTDTPASVFYINGFNQSLYNGTTKTPYITSNIMHTLGSSLYLPEGSNGSGTTNFGWPGDIMEFIIYPSAISLADKKAVECYLANKWDIYAPYCTANQITSGSCPGGVSACKAWYDASDTATIFKTDGTTGGALTDGSEVGIWLDKSGNGNDAAALFKGSGLAPLYKTNVKGSKSGIFYNKVGSTDVAPMLLQNMLRFTTNEYSAVAVYNNKRLSSTTSYINQNLYSGPNTSADTREFSRSDKNVANACAVYASNKVLYNGVCDFDTFRITSTIQGVGLGNGTTGADFYFNGEKKTYAYTGYTPNASAASSAFTQLGSNIANASLYGNILEIAFFDSALSDTDRKKVECYMADKWGMCSDIKTTSSTYCSAVGSPYCP